MLKPQLIALVIGLALVIGGLLIEEDEGVKGVQTQEQTSGPRLEVRSLGSSPAPTSDILQGAGNLQDNNGGVDTSSTSLSQILQPNSGRNSFSEADNNLQ